MLSKKNFFSVLPNLIFFKCTEHLIAALPVWYVHSYRLHGAPGLRKLCSKFASFFYSAKSLYNYACIFPKMCFLFIIIFIRWQKSQRNKTLQTCMHNNEITIKSKLFNILKLKMNTWHTASCKAIALHKSLDCVFSHNWCHWYRMVD